MIMKKLLIAILLIVNQIESSGQEFLAKMKISTQCINGLTFCKDELIVVFKPFKQSINWAVWNSNGENCYLDTTTFQIIPNKPIFKINTICPILKYNACSEPIKEDFKLIKVDYCSIVTRIIDKDTKALTEFFDLIPKVDAALAEIHAEDTWPIINSLTDSELLFWLKTLDDKRLIQFMNYIKDEFVAYPITRYAEYLDLYYPKSYTILKKYK